MDHRGVGGSDGPRNHFLALQQIAADQVAFTRKIAQNNEKVFLFGNSMGAATAITMCVQAPELYHGVILCCPFFQLFKKDQSKVAKMLPLAKIAQKVWPSF